MEKYVLTKWERDIEELMTAFDQSTRIKPDSPAIETREMNLRSALVREESAELIEAIEDGCLPSIAKEIIDVLVVTIGVARSYGIDLDPIWDAVQESNMKKIAGRTDPETGKRLKPEGWEKPDIESLLRKQGWCDEC